jgi:hypothetical protein
LSRDRVTMNPQRFFSVLTIGLALAPAARAFDTDVHASITKQVLSQMGFTDFAAFEISGANLCVDLGPTPDETDNQCLPPAITIGVGGVIGAFGERQLGAAPDHFDDEKIPEGVARLADLRDKAVFAAQAQRWILSRKLIGAALHSIQDFYAHTNWVELGKRTPFSGASITDLRFSLPDKPGRGAGAPRVATWGESVCRLAATFVEHKDLVDDASAARPLLLTSGYFFSTNISAGKCSHGALLDGINKDKPNSYHGAMRDSTGSSYHEIAVALAAAHTKAFVEDVLAKIGPDRAVEVKTTLFQVHANKKNKFPVRVQLGDTWEFTVPTDVTQEITWGYGGILPGMGAALKAGPEGSTESNRLRIGLVPPPMTDQKVGALIGVVEPCADDPSLTACPQWHFYIGLGKKVTMQLPGTLFLMVNDKVLENNAGSFSVELTLSRVRPR